MTLKQDFGVGVTQQTIKCHDYLILRKKNTKQRIEDQMPRFQCF
jgi:hypothetical protein